MNTSNQTQTFASGAIRDEDRKKPRPDLISPIMERKLAEWLAAGARHYGDRNWELGIPVSRSYASLRRHLNQWALGESDEPHLVAVICNAMFILHTLTMIERGRLPAELDDLPDYRLDEEPQILPIHDCD